MLRVPSENNTVQLSEKLFTDYGSRLAMYENIRTNRRTKMTPENMKQYTELLVFIKKLIKFKTKSINNTFKLNFFFYAKRVFYIKRKTNCKFTVESKRR